jgi:hypothetical protein
MMMMITMMMMMSSQSAGEELQQKPRHDMQQLLIQRPGYDIRVFLEHAINCTVLKCYKNSLSLSQRETFALRK